MNAGIRIRIVVRSLVPDRNPLRRRIDHVRSAVVAAVTVAFAFGGPLVAMAAGQTAYGSGVATERSQRLERHQVPATVGSVTEATMTGTAGSIATLWWRTPAGVTRTATTEKARGDRPGRRRQVWIDRSGALTRRPQTHGQTVTTAVLASACGITVVGIALFGSCALICRRLDRTGAALWATEWRRVAPHWTGRV